MELLHRSQLQISLAQCKAANAQLQAAIIKLESKNKEEKILHHTTKNTMAEAQSSIEIFIEEHPDTNTTDALKGLRPTTPTASLNENEIE